jgi:hypothetical protein
MIENLWLVLISLEKYRFSMTSHLIALVLSFVRGKRGVLFIAESRDAVDLGWSVRVAVEDERGRVGIGTHVFKDQPVANLSALKLSAL